MLNSKIFHSKLLLFGEYSIIKKGNALAVPYPLFEGQLRFKTQENQQQNSRIDPELRAFSQFLKHHDNKQLKEIIDVDSFFFDVGQGLYFNSSIPQGYGVGSSGAEQRVAGDVANSRPKHDQDSLRHVLDAL